MSTPNYNSINLGILHPRFSEEYHLELVSHHVFSNGSSFLYDGPGILECNVILIVWHMSFKRNKASLCSGRRWLVWLLVGNHFNLTLLSRPSTSSSMGWFMH